MFRITKVLNHNTVLAVKDGSTQEYLVVGKGIGFGKKVSERITPDKGACLYQLKDMTKHGSAKELVKSISPEILELSNALLEEAEAEFGTIDRSILFPMADHISFALKRMKQGEQISNPLTEDIRILFYKEYKIAEKIRPYLLEKMQMAISDDEIGYVSLHIHTAIQDSKISEAMQMAGSVRKCITFIENELGKKIEVTSMSYNRLMNHIRYMVVRMETGEKLNVDMNDYIADNFPGAFQIARQICEQMGNELKKDVFDVEVGYLAIHIQRIIDDELGK